MGSDPAQVGTRGGHVAFGNTMPHAREITVGREERGEEGRQFDPRTGLGHVARVQGAYDKTVKLGVEMAPLLFELVAASGRPPQTSGGRARE